MVPLTRRLLWQEKGRFAITVGGIACMIVLILFLFGIYHGVAQGATGYVRSSPAGVWVSMKNSTNLLRSSSFMRSSALLPLHGIDGVHSVTGLLRLIATAEVRGEPVTLFLFGFDPASPLARPRTIAGSAQIEAGELILDRAFAAKHALALGDTLTVQGRPFRVRALSTGTNALVAQFSFMTLADAQRLLGFPGVVSFGLLGLGSTANPARVAAAVADRSERLAAFERDVFVANNLKEMETGILPVLWTIAVFSAVTGATVLTLLLYGAVQERRDDYAVLSALGASHGLLRRVVVQQAALAGVLGFGGGLGLYAACVPLLRRLVPEMELAVTLSAVGATLGAALVVSLLGSWAALRTLRGIYPAEVLGT